MRRLVIAAAAAVVLPVLAVLAGRAGAYPQYQLSGDQTCSGCHVAPAGGGLLNENGHLVAESFSQFGTPPEFMYGKLPLPDWLALGGDLRGAAGVLHAPDDSFPVFPMQADLYVRPSFRSFSLLVTVGARPAQWITGNGTPALLDRFWSREHYLMWQQDALYFRAGRFMPVFGLRLAEHPYYTRRYGGVPLYGETYAAAIEYVAPGWEAHLTGFVEDPLIDPVVRDGGAAAYTEFRLDKTLAIGAELMVAGHDGSTKFRGGVTAKLYRPSLDMLLQAEFQLVHQQLDGPGDPDQLIGYVMASWPFGSALLLDVGLGHYDPNLAIAGLDRGSLDVNLHWFITSHVELVWQNRVEGIGIGASQGGPTSAWSLLHGHYRL